MLSLRVNLPGLALPLLVFYPIPRQCPQILIFLSRTSVVLVGIGIEP